jgi:hypothetical protein
MNLVTRRGLRFEDVNERQFLDHFASTRSVKRGDYLSTLKNWLAEFPGEQMHIEFFEEIASNPKELLMRVFAHLNVSRDVDWNNFPLTEKVFTGNKSSMPEKFRDILQRMYRDEIELLYKHFGAPVASWRISNA